MRKFSKLVSMIILIVLIILILMLSIYQREQSFEFSQDLWNHNLDYRSKVVEDLLQNFDFLHMTKDDVIKLLGEKYMSIGKETLRYQIGGGALNDEILQFIFDKNEKIIDIGIAN